MTGADLPIRSYQLRRRRPNPGMLATKRTAAYNAIRTVVTLRYPEGHEVPEFLLHIDGDVAWWRWSDEPFDEDS